MTTNFRAISIQLMTFIFALCSILYELLLAQSMSSIMGNTLFRYNMTIGLYVAAMGVGAILFSKMQHQDLLSLLVKTEIFLALLGFFSPYLVLVIDSLFFHLAKSFDINFLGLGIQLPLNFLIHSLIVVIGVLSGFELPLLMEAYKKQTEIKSLNILGIDYIGTLLGALLFPLVMLPYFSIFSLAGWISTMNILGAFVFVWAFRSEFKLNHKNKILLGIMIFCVLLFISQSFSIFNIESFILERFYYR